jgi:hypothetical protein
VRAIDETNGWLAVAPALYAAVLWICRPRALWRTNIAARRFAIGRFAIALDASTRTVVVWVESRKLGQYDARELSVKWLTAAGFERELALPEERHAQPDGVGVAAGVSSGVAAPGVAGAAGVGSGSPLAGVGTPGIAASGAGAVHSVEAGSATAGVGMESVAGSSIAAGPARPAGRRARRSEVELLWDSPAAAGHNRQIIFRVALTSEGDRTAARALEATLREV